MPRTPSSLSRRRKLVCAGGHPCHCRARRHNGRQAFMKTLQELLDLRFGDIGAVPETLAGNEAIRRLAGRGVVRHFKPEPLPAAVLDTLAAVALSSPSKSDLQQRDILIVDDASIRARINSLLKDQDWISGCPHLLVFLGNNRRPRQLHAW